MVNSESSENGDAELLKVLVANNLLSSAQADLVLNDQQNTGMSIDEILVARGWIEEATIAKLRPGRKNERDGKKGSDPAARPGNSYEENLKRYRILLADILGESSE